MQYDLFSGEEIDAQSPFLDRVVCLLGTFSTPARQLARRLCDMGAECKLSTRVSRNVHYVLVGEDAPQDQLDYLRQLNYHGYCPSVLRQADIDAIFGGHRSPYRVPREISKQLHLTPQHYHGVRFPLERGVNNLYTRELYVAPDIRTPQNHFFQMLGDQGIYANTYIDDTTDVIVISDASLQRLERGETDETLAYIERQYNCS
ncbi:MAG: hypothetical protein HUK03_06095, partial [Bacteroidaceae bacterium]|nr:hypothetical protein [Bacteroidaceae bacterium]